MHRDFREETERKVEPAVTEAVKKRSMMEVEMIVNGVSRRLLVDPFESLLYTLRERLNLTGTKEGCDQGTCGACTVLLDDVPVLSCLTPVARCSSRRVTTIEGLAENGELHPVQKHMVETGGIQCGFCTPGMVMTAVAFLREKPRPDEREIREAISGNLCRCTGYAKIVEAISRAAEEMQS